MFSIKQTNSNTLRIAFYLISIFIKNSPEILINQPSNQHHLTFIFGLIKFSPSYQLTIMFINLFVLICGLFQFFIRKKSIFSLQLVQYILGPIQIYLSCCFISKWSNQSSKLSISFYALNLIIFGSFLLISPIIFNFKYDSYRMKGINTISKWYEFLVSLNFLLITTFPVMIQNSSIIIVILLKVQLIKSLIFFTRINYEQSEIEYCGILGQLTSWINFICITIYLLTDIDCSMVLWVNSVVVIYLTKNKNKIIVLILQRKYRKAILFVRHSLDDDINSNHVKRNTFDQKSLIQLFAALINIINQNQLARQKWRKITFCKSLFSQILSIVQLFERFEIIQSEQDANIDQDQMITKRKKTFHKNKININIKKTDKQVQQQLNIINLSEQNIRYQWQLIWQLINRIKQIQRQQYRDLRNILINKVEIINIKTNYKLIYLFYLNNNNTLSYVNKIHQLINYQYLTKNIFREHDKNMREMIYLQVDDYEIKQQLEQIEQNNNELQHNQINNQNNTSYNNNNKSSYNNNNCLQYLSRINSTFDLYYKQTQIQNLIHYQFHHLLYIENHIIQLIANNKQKQLLLSLLIKKNYEKSEIKQTILSMKSINQFKYLIYKFMYQFYINNQPNVALNNLTENHFDFYLYDDYSSNNKSLRRTNTILNINNSNNTNKSQNQNNNMIVFISGINNFGLITHCCSIFKQKMQLGQQFGQPNKNNTISQKLSILNMMLPIWIDKHHNLTKMNQIFQQPSYHKGKKFHMLSFVQKIVFQISFQIHYIVRDMNDLLLGLDISYKQLKKLKIYRHNQLVFSNAKDQPIQMSQRYNQVRYGNNKKKVIQQDKNFVKKQVNLKQYKKSQQIIFGQNYQIYRTYKHDKYNLLFTLMKDNDNIQQTQSISINKNTHNPQTTKNVPSIIQYVQSETNSDCSIAKNNRQKLINEVKIKQYSKSNLFYKTKYNTLNFLNWQIPPVILCICLLVRTYASIKQAINYNLYVTKFQIEDDFLLCDTHLQNNLYLLFQLNMQSQEISLQDMIDALSLITNDIRIDAITLAKRKQNLLEYIQKDDALLNTIFQPSNDENNIMYSSFYFNSLLYQEMTYQYYKIIGFDPLSNKDISPYMKQFSKIQMLQIDKFFSTFKHIYSYFFNTYGTQFKSSLFEKIQQTQLNIYEYPKMLLTYFLIVLNIGAVISAAQFAYLYIDLQFNIQKIALSLVNFSDFQIKKIQNKIEEIQVLLENCKSAFPQKIIKKYHKINVTTQSLSRHTVAIRQNQNNFNHMQSTHNISANQLTMKSNKNNFYVQPSLPYSSRNKIFVYYLPQILTFAFLIISSSSLLFLFVADIISQVNLIQKFSYSNQQLSKVTAISNQIGLQMSYAIGDKGQSLFFVEKVNQYEAIDKLAIIQSLTGSQQQYLYYAFSNVCQLFPQQPNRLYICKNTNIEISYSQVLSSNLKHFKAIISHLEILPPGPQRFTLVNTHLQIIHKQLSIVNWFTEQFFKISQFNYNKMKKDPTNWLNLLIVEMFIIILLLNSYSYYNVYIKMKVFYQEMFNISPCHQLMKINNFRYYINLALQHKITYVTGQYTG